MDKLLHAAGLIFLMTVNTHATADLNIFKEGDPARASEVNENFKELEKRIISLEEHVKRLEKRPALVSLLNETSTNKQFATSSTGWTNYWGPFELDTEGGALLVLFDVNFAGNSTGASRTWMRLMLDGKPIRVAEKHDQGPWELNSFIINYLTKPTSPGRHFLELQWKVNKGKAYFPHINKGLSDQASRKLLVFELR